MKDSTENLLKKGIILPIMESFFSIQGEGSFTGKSAHFIRIGGCDVGCHWCDVKESWNPKIHPLTRIEDTVKKIATQSETVVVTGGEPLMWDMNPLTKLLRIKKFQTHLETSGAYAFSGEWDWVCLSPKKTKSTLESIYPFVNELKIIIYNNSDFKFAEKQAKKVPLSCKLYLQPEWSKRFKITPEIIQYVQDNPKWRISLQTHKYLNIP